MTNNKVLAIVGCDADKNITDSLADLGFSVVLLPRHTSLPAPVSSHADMLMFELNGYVFAEKQYIENNASVFEAISSYGYKIVPCEISLGNEYPNDIAFNVARIGNSIYGSIYHNAQAVIEHAKRNRYKLSPIKQGYAKCSTVILGTDAIITADSGIASTAQKDGFDVLKISNSPEAVTLKGYNYGFIGGACGVYKNTVYFIGSVERHPQGEEIRSFCNKFGFDTVNLSASALVDIGGIIFLPYAN